MDTLQVKEMGCHHILNQVESEKKTHKYRIEIPTSEDHAYIIDKNKNDALWKYAIRKEI